jgi:hypothetical protein
MKIKIPELQKFFLKCEDEYPVDKWALKGIQVWPILKVIIYFNLYRNNSGLLESSKDRTSKLNRLKRKIKNGIKYLYGWYYRLSLHLEKSDFIFSGAPSHRVIWKGKKFNRYFDPILDHLAKKGEKGYLLEYGAKDVKTVHKPERVINLNIVRLAFRQRRIKTRKDKLWDNENFNLFLNEVEEIAGLNKEGLKKQLLRRTNIILDWAKLFDYFFKKTEAKYAFGLCYYSNAMYGFNLAANNLGVRTIDMQHGLQGYLHPAYYFKKVPHRGFNILPKDFWVWDEPSYRNIENWVFDSPHNVILGGNPWIDFITTHENMKLDLEDSRPMILFTLQPLEPLFSTYLIEVIKRSYNKFNWWLRFHPRMKDFEIEEIFESLNNQNLTELVNIEEASNLPLPLLLNNCQLHISKSSGAIAEAALMHKYSLIIDEVGINSYQDLISTGMAFACLTEDPEVFLSLMDNVLTLKKGINNRKLDVGYTQVIDNCCL